MGLRWLFAQFFCDGCCSGIDKLVGFSQTECAAHLFFDINHSILSRLEEVLISGIMLDSCYWWSFVNRLYLHLTVSHFGRLRIFTSNFSWHSTF